MIAPMRTERSAVVEQHQEQFLAMLPQIRSQARRAFRELQSSHRDDMVQEVIASAFSAYVSLVRRGKAEVAHATSLANFAIRQAIAGRRVGSSSRLHDVTSPFARSARGVHVERLDGEQSQLQAALVEDRRATPADIAAARIDISAWFQTMSENHRRIALLLASGETTSEVARQFNMSPARISQIRRLLKVSWETFQGERKRPTH